MVPGYVDCTQHSKKMELGADGPWSALAFFLPWTIFKFSLFFSRNTSEILKKKKDDEMHSDADLKFTPRRLCQERVFCEL